MARVVVVDVHVVAGVACVRVLALVLLVVGRCPVDRVLVVLPCGVWCAS